jgi:hypothetical protein
MVVMNGVGRSTGMDQTSRQVRRSEGERERGMVGHADQQRIVSDLVALVASTRRLWWWKEVQQRDNVSDTNVEEHCSREPLSPPRLLRKSQKDRSPTERYYQRLIERCRGGWWVTLWRPWTLMAGATQERRDVLNFVEGAKGHFELAKGLSFFSTSAKVTSGIFPM